jgi:hypothetical protein
VATRKAVDRTFSRIHWHINSCRWARSVIDQVLSGLLITDYLSLSSFPSREIRRIAGGKRFLECFIHHFFQVPILIRVIGGTVDN